MTRKELIIHYYKFGNLAATLLLDRVCNHKHLEFSVIQMNSAFVNFTYVPSEFGCVLVVCDI